MSLTTPFSKRPRRGPTMIAPSMPDRPPTMCTTPEPAKSIMPTLLKTGSPVPGPLNAEIQPLVSHTQCTTTGYTHEVRKNEYSRYASNEVRSATEPPTIVDAVAANAHWKKKYA